MLFLNVNVNVNVTVTVNVIATDIGILSFTVPYACCDYVMWRR